ncbi:hypothetical protein THRCLA_04921 [Thraustotheca clavata]|uniref:Bromo domain-containing protein n=1 Tax=Thraustotheca clavata TaxID=74557 RepID=A0A1V9ZXJ2_9STRA|nr:hypothetical protein THRCLA_04921 [Thraustotheca clavata]
MAARENRRSKRLRVEDESLLDVMKNVLKELRKKDVFDLFGSPVDTNEVPDYLSKISTPMDFGTIEKKLDVGKYLTFDEFKLDVVIVFNNAQNYNVETTIYYREAVKLESVAYSLFADAENRLNHDNEDNVKTFVSPTKQARGLNDIKIAARTPAKSLDDINTPMFDLGVLPPTLKQNPPDSIDKDDNLLDGKEVLFHDLTLSDIEQADDSFVYDDVIHAPPAHANDGLFIYDEESIDKDYPEPEEDMYTPQVGPSQDSNPQQISKPSDEVTSRAESTESEIIPFQAPELHKPQSGRTSPLQKENQFPQTQPKSTNNGWLQSKRLHSQASKSQSFWNNSKSTKPPPSQHHNPKDLFGVVARNRKPRQVLLDKFIQPTNSNTNY